VTTRTLDPSSLSIDRLRNAEYTGENRCFPCTLVNLAIATASSVVVAALAPLVGVLLFGVSLLVIYLRGYLVPGTPMLTKRYLPDSVLGPFDKRGDDPAHTSFDDVGTIESFLRSNGALTVTADRDDLELTDSFRRAHRHQTVEYGEDDALLAAAGTFLFDGTGVGDSARLVTLDYRPNAVVLRYDGRSLARWESRAAMVGDVAAAEVLAARTDDWAAIAPETRLQVLGALRLWYEQCPACGGSISLGTDVVESCCRSVSVLAATCDGCGSRVFETGYDDSLTPT
jgi:hypothetical protein